MVEVVTAVIEKEVMVSTVKEDAGRIRLDD